jgi:hypothetical protein
VKRYTQPPEDPPQGGRRWLPGARSRDDGAVAQAGQRAHAAMLAGDWNLVRLLLHPYLYWTDLDGATIRGRDQVLATLKQSVRPPAEARSIELRDGQIYRWRA